MIRKALYLLIVIIGISTLILTGCSSSGTSVGVSYSYGGYYDPYPYWGNSIVVTPPPNRPNPPPSHRPKPEQPIAKPPSIGRPRPTPRPARR